MNDTPPKITTVLFIGGVLDRRRRRDKNLKYLKVAEPEPCPPANFDFSKPAKINLRKDLYRRETLKSGETTWVVYVLDSMTVTQAMGALIKGYYLHDPEQAHLQCLAARAQRDKAEAELASERALADQLAAIVQRSRDGHGGMLTDPECFCEDCEHLRVLDAALNRWKEARK